MLVYCYCRKKLISNGIRYIGQNGLVLKQFKTSCDSNLLCSIEPLVLTTSSYAITYYTSTCCAIPTYAAWVTKHIYLTVHFVSIVT